MERLDFVSGLMKAMEQDLSVLKDNVKPYKRPEEDFSFFFEDNIVSEHNIKRFLDSDILVGRAPVEGESFALEYWDGPVFRRIYTVIGVPKQQLYISSTKRSLPVWLILQNIRICWVN